MAKELTQRQLLEKQLQEDEINLDIRPYNIKMQWYQIESSELKAVGAYDSPTFTFIIRWIRLDSAASSYHLAFHYNTKWYTKAIQDTIDEYFDPQMKLWTSQDRYQDLKDAINKIHFEYRRDTKDIAPFILQFETIDVKFDCDREGIDFTKIKWEITPTAFVELMKMRRNLNGQERFACLITDEQDELRIEYEEARDSWNKEHPKINLEFADPLKQFENALILMKNDIWSKKTAEVIKEAIRWFI